MTNRDLGAWILPQPVDKELWVNIPKHVGARFLPFGYKECEEDPTMLEPIPLELEALAKAKLLLRQYSYEKVAHWLFKTTGRKITKDGLSKRIKNEQSHKRKAAYYRNLARRLNQTLRKAQAYERALGQEGDESFFNSERYVSLRDRVDEFCGS
jgi:hypothetical protein|tara:strand:- start:2746 stop:3207 length:462 start_codon:yes stop_codon:yes gene_type:complete